MQNIFRLPYIYSANKLDTLALFLHCKIILLQRKKIFDTKTIFFVAVQAHENILISIIPSLPKKGVLSSSTGSKGNAVNTNGLLLTWMNEWTVKMCSDATGEFLV